MTRDDEHLHLLSIFHYVVAALAGVFSLFPVIHLLVGIGMTAFSLIEPKETFPIAFVGIIFIAFASLWIILGLTFSICLLLSGRYLKRKTHYQYCLVMAGMECIFMPFGTVLGVFTIIYLVKEDVRAMFGGGLSSEKTIATSHDGV
jgi:hypothetical protein